MTASRKKSAGPSAVAAYDLVILGSGPAGQRAAIAAARRKKRVLVVEKEHVGGHCLHKATIPSKTLREAALLTDMSVDNYLERVMERKRRVVDSEVRVLEQSIGRTGVEYLQGTASFQSPHRIRIQGTQGISEVEAANVLIAVGSSPHRPDGVPFDGRTIFDSDTILDLRRKPQTLAVVGGGVIGCEYASIFARMGSRVTLVNRAEGFLRGVDTEIAEALKKYFEESGMILRLGVEFESIEPAVKADGSEGVAVGFDGKLHVFDALLYCAGRKGNVGALNLAAAGLEASDRGHIAVDELYRTKVSHIYAAGDVIGAPALAASSAEQGRLAAEHMFGDMEGKFPDSFPYGIYTIPEISWTGRQEEELQRDGIEYVVGRAHYREIARGRILCDDHGFLKVMVCKKTRRLLGVHIFGTGATELVHIGQLAMDLGAPIEFFVNNVFNYPTLAEGYKVAAFDAVNQLENLG